MLADVKGLDMTLHFTVVGFLIEVKLYDDVLVVAHVGLVGICPFVKIELLVAELINVVVDDDVLERVREIRS